VIKVHSRLVPPQTADSLAVVIEDDDSLCRFMSRLLTMLGMECCTFPSAKPAIDSLDQRHPAIIFLDLTLHQSDAIDVIKGLHEKKYTGVVQLMSAAMCERLDAVQWVAMRSGLSMRPPLHKPFRAEAVRDAIASLGLDVPSFSKSLVTSGPERT
jgi:DNA-binding response OmpR family regulator